MSEAPLTSATLAQLYLAQGHREQAAQIVEELLSVDPHDGYALVLRNRIKEGVAGSVEVTGEVTEGPIRIRYSIGELEAGMGPLHLVLASAGLRVGQRGIRVTSLPCRERTGVQEFRRPRGPGSAQVALACLHHGSLRILAQAHVPSWS